MKYLYIYIVLLFWGIADKAVAQETSFSLSECYELARNNYPQIHQHGLINQSEKFQLANISRGWLPQLAVDAQASHQSEVTELPFNRDQLSVLIPGTNIPELSKNQYRVVAQVNQTIWDGGSMRASRALTKAEAEAQRKQLESELYAIRKRVNNLYFGCLLQDELIKQNKILQKDLSTNMERIDAMIRNGMANRSDWESMQVELLNAQQKETELKATLKSFKLMLGAFINKELDDDVLLFLPDVPKQVKATAYNRPELKALDAQSNVFQLRNRQLNAGLMPHFSAFIQGGYGRPALNMLSNEFEGFYVAGVRLSWNIGKFYTLKNERKKIATNRKMIDWQKETFLFNTQLQLTKEETEIQKMKELMKADEKIVRLRSNIKKAAEVKLENGVIAVTDLIREINAEDLAHQKAAVHRIQYVMNTYNQLFTTN